MDIEESYIEYQNTTSHNTDYLSFMAGWDAAIAESSRYLNTPTTHPTFISLLEYLRIRHPTVNAITAAEARLLGISYPLKSGWVKSYADILIDDPLLAKLNIARAVRVAQVAKQNTFAAMRDKYPV